jgi:hypothetical protein
MTDEERGLEGQEDSQRSLIGALKGLQRPTWELELLISGALIFSLFQLPGVLTGWFDSVVEHVSGSAYWSVYWIYYVGMIVVVVLTVTFTIHFLLRGFWVGLCGLNAVFPGKIDLEKVDIGPIAKGVYAEQDIDVKHLEKRVDALASTIFSALSVVLMWVLMFTFYLALFGGAGWLIVSGLGVGLRRIHAWIAFLVVWTPLMLVGLADLFYKKRPEAWGRSGLLGRPLLGVYRVYYWAFLMPFWGPISLTYLTRFSQRTLGILSFFLGLALPLVVGTVMLSGIGVWGYDSYVYFPSYTEGGAVQPRHYDALRDPSSMAPFIQNDMVEDPYVRLVVPFSVDDDNDGMAEVCPDLEPVRSPGIFLNRTRPRGVDQPAEADILECLGRLYDVELNGSKLQDLEWSLFSSSTTGMRGVVTYLPTDGLPRGRNELVVRRTRDQPETARSGTREGISAEADQEEDPPQPYHIPFWR